MAATPGAKIALTGWNAYSRIDAVTGFEQPTWRASTSTRTPGPTSWAGTARSRASPGKRDWYRALPFKVAPERPKTLVIGPGGGSDVLVALGAGSEKVTAVEMNPLMLRFVRHFGAQAGNLYDHPQVETHLSEGRNFLRRSDRRFDVILMGFVDSWAAVASGGLSLSENHLYTVEAFGAYQRAPERRRGARDHALARGHPAPGRQRGRARRPRGGRQAHRGAARAAPATARTRRR